MQSQSASGELTSQFLVGQGELNEGMPGGLSRLESNLRRFLIVYPARTTLHLGAGAVQALGEQKEIRFEIHENRLLDLRAILPAG